MISIGEAAIKSGVHQQTLRRWEKIGKITCHKTPGGHRRYDLDQILSYKNKSKEADMKITIGYARVSTSNKKDDLERQIQVVELFCASKGWRCKTISDIGSGLNYNKTGLSELIRLIETQQVERLVLNYKDRLLRFGSEIIFEICKYHNVEIIVINETEHKTYDQELVEDVLAIITVFSAKLYGSRSHKNKKIIDDTKKLFSKAGDIIDDIEVE